MTRIIVGVCLQGLSIFTGYMSVWMLYSAGWLGILFLSTPLYLASVFLLMRSRAPLWGRVIVSVWPLLFPLTKWELRL